MGELINRQLSKKLIIALNTYTAVVKCIMRMEADLNRVLALCLEVPWGV